MRWSALLLNLFLLIYNRNKIALPINCRRWGWPLSRLPFEQFPTSSPSSPLRRQAKSLECLWEFTLRSAVHFCVWRSLNLYQHSTGISCTDTTWYSYYLSAQQPLSVIVASASSSSILDIRIPHCGTIIKFFLWNVSENPQHIRRVSHSRRLLCIAAFILYRHFCRMVVKTYRLFLAGLEGLEPSTYGLRTTFRIRTETIIFIISKKWPLCVVCHFLIEVW